MGMSMIIDFSIFLLLLSTLVGLILAKTVSILNRIYVSLHLSFMLWSLMQFASSTTVLIDYRFLFIKLSYVSLSISGIVALIFTMYSINQSSFLKSSSFKLLILPSIAAAMFILWNPNGLFIKLNADPLSSKIFVQGPYFAAVIGLVLLYVMVALYLLIKQYYVSSEGSMARTTARFSLIGIGLIFIFGLLDISINIINIDFLPSYIPLLSIGMLISGVYMSINVQKINVLDMITIAHQDVMNTISVGILVVDRDHVIIEKNKFADGLLSLQIGESFELHMLGDLSSSQDIEKLSDLIRQRVENPFLQLEFEWSLFRPKRHLYIQSLPIMNKNTELMGYMYTLQDLTEVNTLAESLRRQNLLLQQRNNELIKTQEKLYEANKKLEKIAITDPLTECYNRRYLIQYLEQELTKNIKHQLPFTVIIFDLDYFKLINDAYGHLNGDTVLVQTAKKVNELLNPNDRLARYGGEEFIVYLPALSASEAQQKAELIKNEIEHHQIWIEDAKDYISVTISAGLITVEDYDRFKISDSKVFLQEIMHLADTALYEAKYKGRNLIVNRSSIIS